MHAYFHQAFTDGGSITEAGEMTDGIKHDYFNKLLCFQRRLDRIRDIGLIHCTVNLAALPKNRVQVRIEPAGHDLVNLSEAQSGPQPAGNSLDRRGASAGGFTADFLDGDFERLGGKANGMRKALMQDQE